MACPQPHSRSASGRCQAFLSHHPDPRGWVCLPCLTPDTGFCVQRPQLPGLRRAPKDSGVHLPPAPAPCRLLPMSPPGRKAWGKDRGQLVHLPPSEGTSTAVRAFETGEPHADLGESS